jgi:cytochrome c553
MRSRLATALAAALLFSCASLAQQPAAAPAFAAPNLSDEGVRAMAMNCAACHGTNGRPAEGSPLPRLAGQSAGEIIEKMNAFREGKREATLMHQIAKGYGEAEIAALAAWFARQSP